MSKPRETNSGKGDFPRISDFHKFQDGYDNINFHGTQPFYVQQDNGDGIEEGWYFWDETYSTAMGPYNTRHTAKIYRERYCKEYLEL